LSPVPALPLAAGFFSASAPGGGASCPPCCWILARFLVRRADQAARLLRLAGIGCDRAACLDQARSARLHFGRGADAVAHQDDRCDRQRRQQRDEELREGGASRDPRAVLADERPP
jgi:hypothetical protein